MEPKLFLKKIESPLKGKIHISGSKSESNRLLILNALYNQVLQLENLSNSDDTRLLKKALESQSREIDIHHAGTAMRFLTAYFSVQENITVTITGSQRMKNRPIGVLVDALRQLGADITYLEQPGFPPLKIKGKKIQRDFVELDANISSQFITALMLIAPKLQNGLTIKMHGKITSIPYIKMTMEILNRLGVKTELNEDTLRIFPISVLQNQKYLIESDWSSASYFYSMAALAESTEIKINSFFKSSLQGDSEVASFYKNNFGVETKFFKNQLLLKKITNSNIQHLSLDLNSAPDLAQTIAVTCAGLKVKCKLTGLETLKIKETDRLLALQNELKKVGAITVITNDSLEIVDFFEPKELPTIKTYNDHRMAMSFAPLSLLRDLSIENPSVVEKSYPDFWTDFYSITSVGQ